MKNAITNYENTFFMGQTALSGIISVDGSYSLSVKPVNAIGAGYLKQILAEVPSASVSVSRYLVNNDPVFQLTGNGVSNLAEPIDGGLRYNNRNFAFQNAYLKSYNISCSVGEIPQIQSEFDIFGNIGSGYNPSGNIASQGVFVPQVKNIIVTCNNSSTNRVKNFNIGFDCPNVPVYVLRDTNAEYPIEVYNEFPIAINGSFSLEVDDYQTKDVFDILNSDMVTSFSVAISGTVLKTFPLTTFDGIELTTSDTNETLITYRIEEDSIPIYNYSTNDAVIVSEQINSSADDVLSVKVSYKSYLN